MAGKISLRKYRFPLVRPAVPPPGDWLPLLQESYDHGWFSNFGPVAGRLEGALAESFGEAGDEFVLTLSATAGLAACLIAKGIVGPVLTPAFTFPATAGAIRMAGAEPVLVDVSSATWACDAEKLEYALKRTGAGAVVLVAPFGISQNFTRHVALCEMYGAAVIVDNAAGLGGGPRERSGLRGNALEVYSLHATKPLAVGEGGAIQADRDRAPALRSAINFGLAPGADGLPTWGINGKMAEVSAAIGLAALAQYPVALGARRAQVRRYIELFDRFDRVTIHRGVEDAPWQVFPCLLPSGACADDFEKTTALLDLQIRRYYRPSLSEWGGIAAVDDCPISRDLSDRMVCLPVYSAIAEEEIEEMHDIVRTALQECLRRSS